MPKIQKDAEQTDYMSRVNMEGETYDKFWQVISQLCLVLQAIPQERNIVRKEAKTMKYKQVLIELQGMWRVETVFIPKAHLDL